MSIKELGNTCTREVGPGAAGMDVHAHMLVHSCTDVCANMCRVFFLTSAFRVSAQKVAGTRGCLLHGRVGGGAAPRLETQLHSRPAGCPAHSVPGHSLPRAGLLALGHIDLSQPLWSLPFAICTPSPTAVLLCTGFTDLQDCSGCLAPTELGSSLPQLSFGSGGERRWLCPLLPACPWGVSANVAPCRAAECRACVVSLSHVWWWCW